MKLSEKVIPVSVGVVGEIARNIMDSENNLGILSSLGILAVDRILGIHKESISEKVAKFRKKDYLIGIFDFKRNTSRTK